MEAWGAERPSGPGLGGREVLALQSSHPLSPEAQALLPALSRPGSVFVLCSGLEPRHSGLLGRPRVDSWGSMTGFGGLGSIMLPTVGPVLTVPVCTHQRYDLRDERARQGLSPPCPGTGSQLSPGRRTEPNTPGWPMSVQKECCPPWGVGSVKLPITPFMVFIFLSMEESGRTRQTAGEGEGLIAGLPRVVGRVDACAPL